MSVTVKLSPAEFEVAYCNAMVNGARSVRAFIRSAVLRQVCPAAPAPRAR